MHVAFNAMHLVPGETGGSELYARRLIPALLEGSSDFRATIFAGVEAVRALREEPWGADVDLVALGFDPRSRVRRVAAEQTLLPRGVRRLRPDLLHNLFTTAPIAPGVPQVTTILDVIYKRFPETHSGLLARGMALLVPLSARRSARVLTISEAAKKDIVNYVGVPEDRVDVTLLGPALASAAEPVAEQELRSRLGLGTAPIILTVSAKRPHKNLERLIEAVSRVHGVVLIVPGYTTAFEQDLRAGASSLPGGDRIRFTGWVDDATLEGLYRAATCFVFPSLAEGFGLPVLDALARGVPVACSNTSSLPEVAGDAALYFDPTDTDAVTQAIEQLVADPELRARLAEAGPDRAKLFSWEQTAAATLAAYERALP